jgi:glycosyltransferase involved in cell wall biosynthesis
MLITFGAVRVAVFAFIAYLQCKGQSEVRNQLDETLRSIGSQLLKDFEEKGLVIAFDTFFLAKQFRNVGIYEYSKSLLCEFREMAQEDHSLSIRYFASEGYSDDIVLEKSVPGCESVNTSLLRFHRLWRLGLVSAAAKRAHADLVFTPSPNILPLGLLPVAVTIHDAIPVKLPAELSESRVGLRLNLWVAAKLSQKIITDSEHSKNDLIEIYDLPPQKVSVVYLGYDQNLFNTSPVDASRSELLRKKYGIHGPYILHHGMVQLRKNLARLIEAYDLVLNRHTSLGLQLVLAGPFGKGSDQLQARANRPPAKSDRVIFTGPLESEDLAVLVKGASLCVIPSLYEGFCLPMIEAMASGVPTIAANSSCLPEVSGGVLRYFDPLSHDDMASTMEDVLEHTELQKDLATRGLKRSSEFSWRRCAEETLKALTRSNEN